jgi:hypothetical protein
LKPDTTMLKARHRFHTIDALTVALDDQRER